MNHKTTYLLFGVLLGIAGVFVLAQVIGTSDPKAATALVPSMHDITSPVKADDIDSIEIDRLAPTKERLQFVKDAKGSWVSKSPSTRLSGPTVGKVLDQILTAKRDPDADLGKNLSEYGLEDPKAVITITRKDPSKTWRVFLGNQSAGGEKGVVYCASSDNPKEVMAIPYRDIDMLFKGLPEFRSRDLAAESGFDITEATLREPKREELTLEKSGNDWKFVKPAYGEADMQGEPPGPAKPGEEPKITGVNGLTNAIANLRVESPEDFGPVEASEKEIAENGLAAKSPEKLQISVKIQKGFGTDKKDPTTETLLIGKKADDKGEKLWARLASENNLVKLPAKKVDAIMRLVEDPSVLRNRDMASFDLLKTDAINLQSSAKDSLKLRRVDGQWKIFAGSEPQRADDVVVQDLMNALVEKRIVKEFPDASKKDADLGFDKPSAVLSLWVEGINKDAKPVEKQDPKADEKKDGKAEEKKNGKAEAKSDAKADEKKDAKADAKQDAKPEDKKVEPKKDAAAEPVLKDEKPTLKLTFGRRERDIVYVKRESGGIESRFGVPVKLLERVQQDKLAFLDRRLPTFVLNANITKVNLLRGKDPLELAKDDKQSPAGWKMVLPKELGGRSADGAKVERIISNLRDLLAEKYVAEKPSENMLDNYGFKAPTAQATLTIENAEKKTEDITYVFGKETDDKSGYYARLAGKDLLFIARKGIVDDIRADLQDPTLLKFSLEKLKGIKITGWQDIVLEPVTIDLKRESPTAWTSSFAVDPAQAEGFANTLTDLKAEKFAGKAKPEYKLETKDGALQLVLSLEGEKEPVTLTIGAPLTTDGYYATCSRLPGEVVVLPKGSFDKVKLKPAYFKK